MYSDLDDIQTIVLIDKEKYDYLLDNIYMNYLLIIFTMSCVCGLLCSYKKREKDYTIVSTNDVIEGEIIQTAQKV